MAFWFGFGSLRLIIHGMIPNFDTEAGHSTVQKYEGLTNEDQAVVGTFQPTHHTPMMATIAINVWPKPGSPDLVITQIEANEAMQMIPAMTTLEWKGNDFPVL